MSDIKERFKELGVYYNKSERALESYFGLGRGNISGIGKGIGSDKLAKIHDTHPEINLVWLITGKGEMIDRIEESPPIIIDPADSNVIYFTEKLEKYATELGELRKEREMMINENRTLRQEINELKGIKKYSIDLPQSNAAEPKLKK